ncbi:alpha/beta hydrolase [Altererythrobacter xixiisoli]|uniref:Alpha/beta hydrolase n=1 Tax=Croceibacterium xixiisoli TaxID=1476466 RepID=A0A6I4TT96_9SPHN|nr:alpha/beta hydrolase [Croceibacterium xixiisoli]MXO97838.1 alpha/beta hydrolase [Croceibacterium xixiisoli]
MHRIASLFALLMAAFVTLAPLPAAALTDDGGTGVYVIVETTYYPGGGRSPYVTTEYVSVEYADAHFGLPQPTTAVSAQRFVIPRPERQARQPVATYGPFRVLDDGTAALAGITDERSPAAFAAMMRDYPALTMLEFHDCPGTYDDRANLRLGRMIRDAGLDVHVPATGSVRSGAVELVLAGRTLTIDDGARFAVHAWLDDLGREAGDYAPDSEEHRKYLAYYSEVGMGEEEAKAFYAMTNSVSFNSALWLGGAEMRGWVRKAQDAAAPAMAVPAPSDLALAAFDTSIPAELAAYADDFSVAQAPLDANIHPVASPVTAAPQIAYLDLDLLLN